MKLNNPVTITPPPMADPNGKLMVPPPIEFTFLDVTYMDSPLTKSVSVAIRNIPGLLLLVSPSEYDSFGDYTQEQIENRLREKLGDNPAQVLRALFPQTLEENPNGPGTILSGMISAMGIKSTPNCACRRHALEMNNRGPDWCEANIDTILSWLKEESAKRNLPFIETVAKLMVKRAISTSRRLIAKSNG